MNWLEFISSIIKSTAWPVIVLLAILILRKPFETLILKIAQLKLKSFKYKGIEATFEDSLENAESKVDDTDTHDMNHDTEPIIIPFNVEKQFFYEIAKEAPYLGVFMSWHELELELASVFERIGAPVLPGKELTALNATSRIFYFLMKQGYIDSKYGDLFYDLRRMKDQAIHFPESPILYEEAVRYRKLTKKLIAQLKKISSEGNVVK
ncbi:hypothetical protein [Bacillus velezensis]|uniref:hypothetical protein n=1 Tax=Bacillus velezensis TaxID=492670 RepID=UPI003CFE5AE1